MHCTVLITFCVCSMQCEVLQKEQGAYIFHYRNLCTWGKAKSLFFYKFASSNASDLERSASSSNRKLLSISFNGLSNTFFLVIINFFDTAPSQLVWPLRQATILFEGSFPILKTYFKSVGPYFKQNSFPVFFLITTFFKRKVKSIFFC